MRTFTILWFCLLVSYLAQGQGDTISQSFVHNDSIRSYLLYVPEAYDGSEDWPLVINYHGFTNSAADQMHISQMNTVADTGHFLIAYPQGLLVNNPFLGYAAPGWNVTGTLSTNDDIGFSNMLIDQVQATYAIDAARIYVTGWSMGASIAFEVSCKLADRIAAVAGVSNQMADSQIANCDPGRPLSAMLIQGTADPIVPFDGDGILFSAASVTPSFWAGYNNCAPDSVVTDFPDLVTTDTSTVTLIEYTDCDAGTEVLFYRINGGGHSWPGGGALPPFLGKTNQDINASSEIWNFFQRNPHPNPPGAVLEKSFVHNDSLRSYLLYVPYAYDGSEDWSLVINYHQFGWSPSDYMAHTRMNAVADTGHFLIAYPQGLSVLHPISMQEGPGWNESEDLSVNDDVGFTNALISQVSASHRVDPARIYATGWGMGGGFAQKVQCDLADVIAATALVSSVFTDLLLQTCTPGRPVSMLIMHGTADPFIPFAPDPQHPIITMGLDGTVDFLQINNNCSGESTVTEIADINTEDGSSVSLIEYDECDAGTEIVIYRVNDGGHAWPGGGPLPEFFGAVNQDINASSEIWNFFNRNPHPNPPGEVLAKSFVHNDSLRSYLLYVPYDYDGTEDWPLVINMHGYALNASFQMAFSDMNVVADTGHFLIAYPQGTTIVSTVANIPPQGLGWNVSLESDTVFISPGNVDDVDFISQVIDSIQADYQVAPERIYATGFSNGAMMSHLLALKLNDRIAAIAPVAATIPRSQLAAHSGTTAMPVFHIHGTADPIAFYDGDDFIASVPETMQFWASQNECDADPMNSDLPDLTTLDTSTLELQEWQNCTTEVVHLKVEGGGHQWPGGVNLLPFLGYFNLDVHGSTEIWKFFNRHELLEISTSVQDDHPIDLEALKVYPNPFQKGFTIDLELSKSQTIQMKLVNLLGQAIGNQNTINLSAGNHQLQWDLQGRPLSDGLYYLQLQADGRQLSWPIVYQSNSRP